MMDAYPASVEDTVVEIKNIVDSINYLDKSGDTADGIIVAQSNISYDTKQIRNITLSTLNPSGGSNGDVWIKYTP